MVPRASEEAKGLSVKFYMLVEYVKRGLSLSSDLFTTSITGSEIFRGGLAGSTIWFSIVSISNGVRLLSVYVSGPGLG